MDFWAGNSKSSRVESVDSVDVELEVSDMRFLRVILMMASHCHGLHISVTR